MLRLVSWISGLCFFAISTNTLAYSKNNHQFITEKAAKLLTQCGYTNILSDTDIDTLVEFNRHQDKLFKKSILWHFPMPEEDSENPAPSKERASGYGKIVLEPTFNRWYDYLEDQANKQNSFEARLPAIGAMLHYLQDLAVPAHAIPIFHPSKIMNKDGFDEWNTFASNRLFSSDEVQSFCRSLHAEKLPKTTTLLSEIRRDTLESINNKLDTSKGTETWAIFWSTDITDNGFAHYNCDREDKFGQTKFKCNGKKLSITKDAYIQFATQRVKQAIRSSARLIRHFYSLPSGIRHQCQSDQWLPTKSVLKCLQSNDKMTND